MTLLTMIAKMSEGLGKTCAIFFLTILFSLPLGMLITLLRMSKNKVVSGVTRFVIAVLRGTPLMLQLLAVTYGPYYLFGMAVAKNKLIPVVIAFAINYAAYFAEIYRGGIESIPVGQYEAANVLGYTRAQTFLRIILPQVVKRIMPSITNEVVTLVKDTSMAFTVSYQEMFTIGKQIATISVLFSSSSISFRTTPCSKTSWTRPSASRSATVRRLRPRRAGRSRRWASATRPTPTRASSPAASSSAWPSRVRWR